MVQVPWQVKVAEARMAGMKFPAFGQTAYKSAGGYIRFYPSQYTRSFDGSWYMMTCIGESDCVEEGDIRLTDEEAKAIWVTRPEYMK